MASKRKKNKLTIYLIKENYSSESIILKDFDKLKKNTNFQSGINYYYKESVAYSPKWLENFFLEEPKRYNIYQSSVQMIALIKVNISSTTYRYFAIPFGIGFRLLNPDAIEERFGLKVALNAIDEKKMKSIDKKNMSNVPKHAREQISINGEFDSFGIDIEQDLIQGVTGNSKEPGFGKIITGKDNLCISVDNNIEDIKLLLENIYAYYLKDDYKNNFGWIDYIKECKDRETVNILDSILIENIKSKIIGTIWMAVPEIIEWSDVEGFKYPKCKDYLFEDITLQNMYEIINEEDLKNIDINFLKKKEVECIPTTGVLATRKWKYYNCIYAEIKHENALYILSNGKYYFVESDFKTSVDNDYKNYLNRKPPIVLPESNTDNEYTYNKSVNAIDNKYCLMDRKLIFYGGGYSKIEFCDLYHESKVLFHVKNYGGSAVLSHLFNQAFVSSELFCSDSKFRDEVNTKLDISHRIADTSSVDCREYSIVLAIMSSSIKALDIPFFSKVSLRNVWKQMEGFGYKVFLQKVQISASSKENCKKK